MNWLNDILDPLVSNEEVKEIKILDMIDQIVNRLVEEGWEKQLAFGFLHKTGVLSDAIEYLTKNGVRCV